MPRLDTPQAPLSRVRVVVDAVAGGSRSRPSLSRAVDISARHIGYALTAARLLHLVDEQDGDLSLTEAGLRLSETPRGSPEETNVLREQLGASAELQRLAPALLDANDPSLDRLAARIAKLGKLSESTARRRASVLLGWRRTLLEGRVEQEIPTGVDGSWRRIHVKNYRSIQEISVDLPPFSAVVGPNGSGKSNFADVLVFAAEVGLNAATTIERRGGITGVRRWRPTKPTVVVIDVRVAASAEGLERDYVRHAFKIRSGAAGDWSFADETVEVVRDGRVAHAIVRKNDKLEVTPERQRLPYLDQNASVMALASQLKDLSVKTIPLRTVLRYRLNPDKMREPTIASETGRLDENGQNIASAVRAVVQAGRGSELEARLAQIVPGLEGLGTEQVGRYLVLKFRQRQDGDNVAEFNATEMSDGALRALGILVATLQMRRHELLVIEEPEVSVHVGAAGFLYDVLRQAAEKGTVLLTTHSADLLDAAADDEILVCEYAGGVTRVGRLAAAQRQVVRDGLFSLAELMRSEPLRMES